MRFRLIVAVIFGVSYILIMGGLVGWRSDHNFFLALVFFTLALHPFTFRFCLTLSAFAFFWIIYDAMRVYPNYLFNRVHILEPYQLELALFGIMDQGREVIPCEWFASRTNRFLSSIAGMSYLCWVPGPLSFTLYMWYKGDGRLFCYSYGFLLTNFLGFILYYLYPAAPPWYYLEYGLEANFDIPGNAGLLVEFDKIINYPVFSNMYNKNSNVFAAIPSLHAAYPLISLFFALRYHYTKWAIFFSFLTIGIWFAAVYSQHHYVIDLLLGGFCAIGGYYLMNWIYARNFAQKVFNVFIRLIIT